MHLDEALQLRVGDTVRNRFDPATAWVPVLAITTYRGPSNPRVKVQVTVPGYTADSSQFETLRKEVSP